MLIVALGAAGNFFVRGAAYAVVLLIVYRMVVPATPGEARRTSPLANLKEGLSYVWTSPIVFALMAAALVLRVFAMPFKHSCRYSKKMCCKWGRKGWACF